MTAIPAGEISLSKLISTLTPILDAAVFVFVTLPRSDLPHDVVPRMLFREAEGVTLILEKSEAQTHKLPYTFPCRMITCDVHSSLEAVGFLAAITAELSKAGMGVNPVSGYFHDHLFVPEGREDEAMALLRRLALNGNLKP